VVIIGIVGVEVFFRPFLELGAKAILSNSFLQPLSRYTHIFTSTPTLPINTSKINRNNRNTK